MITPRCLLALVALAAAVPDALAASAFDARLRALGGVCLTGASTSCYARAFAAADRNADGRLDLAEAELLWRELQGWTAEHLAELTPADRNGLLLGLLAVQLTGVPTLFAGFDSDRDGLLSPEELSADVTLDERPVPVLIRDPAAVDWHRLLGRLGGASSLLDGIVAAPAPP